MKNSVQFIQFDQHTHQYTLTSKAQKFITQNRDQIYYICSIIGSPKTGKSYLINKLFFPNNTYISSPDPKFNTKGVYFYQQLVTDSKGIKLMFLDFQGFDICNKKYQQQLLKLAFKISDIIVLNYVKIQDVQTYKQLQLYKLKYIDKRINLVYVKRDMQQNQIGELFLQKSQMILRKQWEKYIQLFSLPYPTIKLNDSFYICDCKLKLSFKLGVSLIRSYIEDIGYNLKSRKENLVEQINKILQQKKYYINNSEYTFKSPQFMKFNQNEDQYDCQNYDLEIFCEKQLTYNKKNTIQNFDKNKKNTVNVKQYLKNNINILNIQQSIEYLPYDPTKSTNFCKNIINPFTISQQFKPKLISINLSQQLSKFKITQSQINSKSKQKYYVYLNKGTILFKLHNTIIKQSNQQIKYQFTLQTRLQDLVWIFTRNNKQFEAIFGHFKLEKLHNLDIAKSPLKLLQICMEYQYIRNSKVFQKFIKLNKLLINFPNKQNHQN